MKVLFTILCCAVYLGLSGQTVRVSEAMPLRTDTEYDLIGKLGEHYLVFEDRSPIWRVQAWDEELKQVWEEELELDKKRPDVLGTVAYGSSFFILYRFRMKNKTRVKLHQYDAKAQLVDSMEVHQIESFLQVPTVEVIRSEDYSKLLIYYSKNDKEVVACCFDLKTMTILWETIIPMTKVTLTRDFEQLLLDDLGRMYWVLSKDNFKYKREQHHYVIQVFDGAEQTEFMIPMKERLTYDVYFQYDNVQDRLVAGGLYSDKHLGRANGYFFFSTPPTSSEGHLLKFHPLEDALVETFLGKDANNKNRGVTDVVVKELVLRYDGGALLVLERNRVSERDYGRPNGTYTSSISQHYHDDLLVLSIHPDGETHWATILHKKQESQDGDEIYASYFLAKTPGVLRFLFNDDIQVENTVSEYLVKSSGQFDRNSVMSTGNQNIRLRFQDGLQLDAKRILVPSEYRNELKLVEILFD